MASNLLQSIETKEQLHNVLAAINEAFPNHASIETELGKYTASKEQSNECDDGFVGNDMG